MNGYSVVDFEKYGEFVLTTTDGKTALLGAEIGDVLTDEDKMNLFHTNKPCYVRNATGQLAGKIVKVSGWLTRVSIDDYVSVAFTNENLDVHIFTSSHGGVTLQIEADISNMA